jgi:hypothetical protein
MRSPGSLAETSFPKLASLVHMRITLLVAFSSGVLYAAHNTPSRDKMLPTVHAYRDDGPQAHTRWKPRRVFCTLESDHSDAPGTLYVAKLAVGRVGAAALISETVCTHLLRDAGFRTLDSAIIRVSDGFALSCNAKSDYPGPISTGDYYATLHRDDVEAGPPPTYDLLAQPRDLLKLWVYDTWLANIDREVDGNILLSLATGGRFHVIAADQSDCFCGSSTFCSGAFARSMETRGHASSVSFLPRVILENGGPRAVRQAASEARYSAGRVGAALALVPESWWRVSSLTPNVVGDVLERRAYRLEEILNPSQWEVPNVKGATLL